jgi:hypothetical protein
LISDRTHWSIPLTAIAAGSKSFLPKAMNVVVDSGTTFVLLQDGTFRDLTKDITTAINQALGATLTSGFYTIGCEKINNGFSLSLKFAGTVACTISGAQMFIQDPTSNLCFSIFQLSHQNDPKGTYIVGSLFLRNFYSVFDYSNARIGFATPTAAELPKKAVPTTGGVVSHGVSTLMLLIPFMLSSLI